LSGKLSDEYSYKRAVITLVMRAVTAEMLPTKMREITLVTDYLFTLFKSLSILSYIIG